MALKRNTNRKETQEKKQIISGSFVLFFFLRIIHNYLQPKGGNKNEEKDNAGRSRKIIVESNN